VKNLFLNFGSNDAFAYYNTNNLDLILTSCLRFIASIPDSRKLKRLKYKFGSSIFVMTSFINFTDIYIKS
jgi:hypothetical protein